MEVNQDQVLAKAIAQYGIESQICQGIEEAGELLTAINKLRRATPPGVPLFSYPTKDTSVKYSLAYFAFCSEIADVKIMMRQFEMILCKEAVNIAEERKIVRLHEKLNDGK